MGRGVRRVLANGSTTIRSAIAATVVLTIVCVAINVHVAAAQGRVIVVDLVNRDNAVSQGDLARAAQALTTQVNRDLRAWWPGPDVKVVVDRPVRHARWLVMIEPATVPFGQGSGVHGHRGAQVWGRVYPSGGVPWTMAASHELLEMLEDPHGRTMDDAFLREVCDPVDAVGYLIGRVLVSDFVTPAWFTPGSTGPWDDVDQLRGPIPTGIG